MYLILRSGENQIKKRNIGLVMLFSLITLGIYELYWLIDTKNEMNRRGQRIPSILVVFLPLLALIAIAILQVSVRFAINASGSDNPLIAVINILSVIVGLVAFIGIVPATIYWIFKYCQAAEAVTGGNLSFGLDLGLWLALNLISLWFIWPGIVQDYFNKVETPEHPHGHHGSPHIQAPHHPSSV